MLNTLQSSVESEEEVWKQRLSEKDEELSAALSDKETLAKKNAALQESLSVVKQAEEVN